MNMDNLFITQHFDWDAVPSWKVKAVNRLLARIGFSTQLSTSFTGHMTSIEQRINLFHLLSQVLAYRVPGDIVEIGTHEGMTAVLLMSVVVELDPGRRIHLYDAFENPSEAVVLAHVERLGLPRPAIHRGFLDQTLPSRLPEQIAFFNIDLGPGRSPELLTSDVHHALKSAYERMAVGSVGVLQDYCDPSAYDRSGFHFPELIRSTKHWNHYPQVKRACDDFFRDKHERVHPLYAGCYSHGYFRKLNAVNSDRGHGS